MIVKVTIQVEATDDRPHIADIITLSPTAIQRARLAFNPSADPRVTRIKALAAALYTELAAIPADQHQKLYERDPSADSVPSFLYDTANQEAFTAAQLVQLGAMMAVSAATAHLVK